jgi:hypothetical protein
MKEGSTYQVVVISLAPIHGLLQPPLLAVPLPPKDLAVALIIGVYRLHQCVNRYNEAGQQ